MFVVIMIMIVHVSRAMAVTMSMVAMSVNIKNFHLNDIEEETKYGHNEHDASKHGLRCNDSESCFIDEPDRKSPNEDDAD